VKFLRRADLISYIIHTFYKSLIQHWCRLRSSGKSAARLNLLWIAGNLLSGQRKPVYESGSKRALAGMKYYHAETVMALWNMQAAIDKALAQSP
jgi:hypothetical protein